MPVWTVVIRSAPSTVPVTLPPAAEQAGAPDTTAVMTGQFVAFAEWTAGLARGGTGTGSRFGDPGKRHASFVPATRTERNRQPRLEAAVRCSPTP